MADHRWRRGWTGAVLAAALWAPNMLVAQDPAPATEPAATEEENPQGEAVLDEITVTAQKREQSIQEVPVAVTALEADQIDLLTSGGGDVKALSGRVPSLTMESSFGRAFPRFYIRGLGNTDFDLNASQPVSMIVDEVVLENPVVKGMPLFDLERVEVLRGPQGTLFGRNTPAGIVKFDTKKPSRDFDADVSASYGTFDTMDVKAAVGGPIGDTLSYRASILFQSQSDWIDNKFTGEDDALGGHDTSAYRFQLGWKPNDRFDALLNVHGWSVDGTARVFRANILKPGTSDLVSNFEQDEVFHDGVNDQHIDSMGGVLNWNYDFGGSVLTSVTGYETLDDMYSRGDIDGGVGCGFCGDATQPGFIPFDAQSADGIPDLDQFTQELRLASKTDGRLDWLFGFYYFDESLTATTFNYLSGVPGDPQFGYAFQDQDTTSWALFGSLDYELNELWSFQAGLRYTTDEKDFVAERPEAFFTNVPTTAPIRRETDADLVTWDLTATRKVNEDLNFYGRLGTGFRAPAIQGRILFCGDGGDAGQNPDTNCVSIADEEKLTSFEVGMKSELLNDSLRLNLALYRYEIQDQQLTAVGGNSNTARLLNADESEGYGFEADVNWAPSSHWLVTLGTSYNKTEIQDGSLLITPCFACTVTDPIVNGLAKIDGNSLPHAPEWIFNGIVDFRLPVGNGLFLWSVDWAYSSEKNFFLYESKEFQSDSFEVGMRIGYSFAEARYEVAAFARNLFDEEIVQGGIDFNNLTGMMNEPRQIGLELVAHF